MSRRRLALGLIIAAMGCVAGCTSPVDYLQPSTGLREIGCSGNERDAVELTYLGAGGFLIRHQGRAIMTAPFFSNPGLLRSLLGFPISPDTARIKDLLPPVDDVEAILVGHAHFDHLMDAIHIAETTATRATFYGSDTMMHIVHARPLLQTRVRSLELIAGDSSTPGKWEPLAGGAMRVMALRSEHAPQFLGVKLFGGTIDHDLAELPRNAYGWKEGQTLAFLIDVLRADDVVRLGPPAPDEGFAQPSLDVRAEMDTDAGKHTVHLRFGRDALRRNQAIVYARIDGVDATFAVARERVDPIRSAL